MQIYEGIHKYDGNAFELLSNFVENRSDSETVRLNPENKELAKLVTGILKKRNSGRLTLLFQTNESLAFFTERMMNHFNFIEAAGGRVFNALNQILLIYRRGKWDLPKGKIESNEKPDQAAWREVAEETGLQFHTVLNPLPPTYHIYQTSDSEWFLKRTYWFDMQTTMRETLKPQKEEQISKALFTEVSFARQADSWPSVHEVLNQKLP